MFTDLDAAALCRALYFFDSDAPLAWDFLDLSDKATGIAWGARADGNGIDNLVFRGTSNIQDALRDIELLPAIPKDPRYAPIGEVHSGFFEEVPRVVDTILARNPKGNIRIMGHSLGAAHAHLVAECLARWGIEAPVFLFGEPPSTKKNPRSARSWVNGVDPVTAPPLWPYTRRKDLLVLNEPPQPDDDWGPWIGFHHIEKYQSGLAKMQAPAPVTPAVKDAVMADTFDTAFQNLLGWEGGYGNAAHDDGGPTNLGVVQAEYDAYRKRKGLLPQSVRYIARAEAEDIYRGEYWDATLCGQMNPGVANCVFDADVNSGDRRGVEWLQQAINRVTGKPFVTVDGKPGPATVAAANQLPPDKIIDAILDIRLAFMKVCRNSEGELLWPHFGHGWNDRIIGVRKQSHALAGLPDPVSPLPSQSSTQPMEPAMTAANTVSAAVPVATAGVNVSTGSLASNIFGTIFSTVVTIGAPLLGALQGTSTGQYVAAGLFGIAGLGSLVTHVYQMVTNNSNASNNTIATIQSVSNGAAQILATVQAASAKTGPAAVNPTPAAAS